MLLTFVYLVGRRRRLVQIDILMEKQLVISAEMDVMMRQETPFAISKTIYVTSYVTVGTISTQIPSIVHGVPLVVLATK